MTTYEKIIVICIYTTKHIHREIYSHIHLLALLGGARSNDTPILTNTPCIQILVSNTIPQIKDPGLLREMGVSTTGAGNTQDAPGVPKSWKLSKIKIYSDKDVSRGCRNQLKEHPVAQTGKT